MQPDVIVPDVIAEPLQDPTFWNFGSAKSFSKEYPQDGYQTLQETKQQRVNLVDVVVEVIEEANGLRWGQWRPVCRPIGGSGVDF